VITGTRQLSARIDAARGLCLAVAVACALMAIVVLNAGAARAANAFGSQGSAAGQMSEPNGIAIDQGSGDVYVLDTNNERVDKFTAEGKFLLAWGWGVANGAAALQTCTAATGCNAGSAGAGAGQLRFSEGLAVDNDPQSPSHHDVYVIDIENYRVQKFSPTGQFLLTFGGHVNITAHERSETSGEDVCPVRPGDVCGSGSEGPADDEFEFKVEGNFIAVGATGIVYVGDYNRVQEFSPSGAYLAQVTLRPKLEDQGEDGGTIALAVNSLGDLYTIRNGISGIQEYSPQGELLQTLNEEARAENNESPTPALTLDPDGHVFVDYHDNEQHRVLEYEPNGAEVASFDEGEPDGLHGLAYGDSAGKLYIVSAASATPIRTVTPPPLRNPLFTSFEILPWLLGP